MLTNNYVSADIQLIVNDAARSALKAHSKITMNFLIAAIQNTHPSLDEEELKRYDKIKAQMEGRISNKIDQRPRIGFIQK